MRFFALCLALCCSLTQAQAAVVISGTRIIYPSDQREVNVEITNPGTTPALVQVWVEAYQGVVAKPQPTTEQTEVPFILTPPIFRVNPTEAQTVRLMYVGDNLPQDRESVYHFNLLDIPPMPDNSNEINYLQMAINSKVKLFYRPAHLKADVSKRGEALEFKLERNNKTLLIKNPTPYFVTLTDLVFTHAGKTAEGPEIEMLSPYSSTEVVIEHNRAFITHASGITASYLNDYGVKREFKAAITR